jgi:hypothetical protein
MGVLGGYATRPAQHPLFSTLLGDSQGAQKYKGRICLYDIILPSLSCDQQNFVANLEIITKTEEYLQNEKQFYWISYFPVYF